MSEFLLFLQYIADKLLEILPDSPFIEHIEAMQNAPWLGWLNWFFPVGSMLVVGVAWLSGITVFYTYQAIMRIVKIIGSG